MKLKKLAYKALSGLMTIAFAVTLLTSCGNESSDRLVENIPADAVMVVKLNPKQIIENSGCSVNNGKIVLSEKYRDALRQSVGATAVGIADTYLAYTEGINMDAVMMYGIQRGYHFDNVVIATVSDEEIVKKNLRDIFGSQSEEDGFTVFRADGYTIALKEGMMWSARNLDFIEQNIEKAQQKNISSLSKVSEALSADNAFAMVVNIPTLKESMDTDRLRRKLERNGISATLTDKILSVTDDVVCMTADLKGNTLTGELFLVDPNNNRAQFGKVFNNIDTDFLKNVPADANFIAACGSISDPDVKDLLQQAADEANRFSGTKDGITDLFTKVDGTVAGAIECNTLLKKNPVELVSMNEADLMALFMSEIKFCFIAHYPAANIQQFSTMLRDELNKNGIPYSTDGNNMNKVDFLGLMNGYFGEKNGYFFTGNNLAKDNARDLSGKFSGKRMVLYSNAPVNPVAASMGWNFGSETEIWLEDDAFKFKNTLTGTNLNYIQAFLEPLTDMSNIQKLMAFIQEMRQAVNSKYGAYNDYYDYYGSYMDDSDYIYDYEEYDEFIPDDSPLNDSTLYM